MIGRDHLDSGSVASPYRETEAMRDGSDAIADWPILNALLNTAAGATWVSVHHGGGVGIGNSIHAGMVVLADGSADAAERLERVLTTDPGTGVMRHADAGYDEALDAAREHGLDLPSVWSMSRLLSATCSGRLSPAGREAPLRGARLREVDAHRGRVRALRRRDDRSGRLDGGAAGRSTATIEELDGRGLCAIPGLVDCHTHPAFGGDRVEEFSRRAAGASYEELHAAGFGILSTVGATRAAGEAGIAEAVQRHRDWMLRAGTTTFEGKSGYGLDRETELASLRAIAAAGGIPTWLGAHAAPPGYANADAYLDFILADVLPDAAQLAEAADVFLERGAFDADAGAPLSRGVPHARPRVAAPRRPVHGGGRDPARDRARRAFGRPPRGDRPGGCRRAGRERRDRRAVARERALPRATDAARPRARRRGRRHRARDRLQPRQRVLRKPPARLLARRDPAAS